MKLGSSLFLVLVGCTSTHVDPAPVQPTDAACRVEVAIESSEGRDLVDLGPGSCTKRQHIGVTRGLSNGVTREGTYFVAVAVSGSPEEPLVRSEVVRLSKNLDADGAESRALVRWMAGDRTDLAGPPAPPAPPRLVVPGQWSEIAAGKWADEEAYRVLVRVAHGT